MNNELRDYYTKLIDYANAFPTLPWEAKRLAFEAVFRKVERMADDAILEEFRKEETNAESLQQDKLGELSE